MRYAYQEKMLLKDKTRRRLALYKLAKGADIAFSRNHITATGLAVMISLVAIRLSIYTYQNRPTTSLAATLGTISFSIAIPIIIVLGWFIALFIIGTPKEAWLLDDKMKRICVKNNVDEAPYLINIEQDSRPNIKKYTFFSYGIPLSFFEDNIEEIEAAMNVNIADIRQGKNKYHIIIRAARYENALPPVILWNDNYIDTTDFNLVLGESLLGAETVNLNTIPHVLIGGSTGSGKTILLKNLLYQAYCKNALVYVADFKGGVDFNTKWRNLVNVVTDIDDLITILDEIVQTLEERKALFAQENCANLKDYNEKYPSANYARIIFGCDEVAELLDKTGALDKAEKEKISIVEKRLSTIARQGRAFGIHLLLATQRPDANILNGQIRNNMDLRICGRADDVLSKIILDNTDASERIPKYEKGLFLTNTNMVIRGYLFTDENLPEVTTYELEKPYS